MHQKKKKLKATSKNGNWYQQIQTYELFRMRFFSAHPKLTIRLQTSLLLVDRTDDLDVLMFHMIELFC